MLVPSRQTYTRSNNRRPLSGEELLATALEYRETRGWTCQPLGLNEQGKAKKPFTDEWQHLTSDVVPALNWSRAKGIGLLTGPASGNAAGIDVDDEELAVAVLDWDARQTRPFLAQTTVSGRCHIFAIEPQPTPHRSFKVWWRGAWRNVQFIGVSSEGAAGNMAIAPSPGYAWVHPDAEPAYEPLPQLWQRIMDAIGATWEQPWAETPSSEPASGVAYMAWRLRQRAPALPRRRQRDVVDLTKYGAEPRPSEPEDSGPTYGPAGYPSPFQDLVPYGDRNNAQFVEAASLFKRGASFDQVVEVLDRRFLDNYEKAPGDSPKGRRAMLATARSAQRRIARERERKQRLDARRAQARAELLQQLAALRQQRESGPSGLALLERVPAARMNRRRDEVVARLQASDDAELRERGRQMSLCRVNYRGYSFRDAGAGDHGDQYHVWSCALPTCPQDTDRDAGRQGAQAAADLPGFQG
jgi:hypothetical protein